MDFNQKFYDGCLYMRRSYILLGIFLTCLGIFWWASQSFSADMEVYELFGPITLVLLSVIFVIVGFLYNLKVEEMDASRQKGFDTLPENKQFKIFSVYKDNDIYYYTLKCGDNVFLIASKKGGYRMDDYKREGEDIVPITS